MSNTKTNETNQIGRTGRIELDLRPLPPMERHRRIFETWNSLKPGESVRITNDHAPKPLQYMFEAEHKGEFEWIYEQEGPVDWIFRIKKI